MDTDTGPISASPDSATSELQYAPRPPLRRSRTFRRVLLGIGLVIVVVAGVYWFPQVNEHVLLQVWQRRCLNHHPPADEVVYDGDPQRAAALLTQPRYQSMPGSTPAAFLVPPYWADLYATISPPGLKSDGTVFLGRMHSVVGVERLVAVDMTVGSAGRDEVLLTTRVVEPASLLGRPRVVSTMGSRLLSFHLLDQPVTPGQIDPQDPAHLLLFGGRVHGWLQPDGNSLNVRPADPRADKAIRLRDLATRPTTRPAR
jgi:hypothetical protein